MDPLGFQASLVYTMRPHAPPCQNTHVLLVSPMEAFGLSGSPNSHAVFSRSHGLSLPLQLQVMNYSSCASVPKEQN